MPSPRFAVSTSLAFEPKTFASTRTSPRSHALPYRSTRCKRTSHGQLIVGAFVLHSRKLF